MSEAGGQQSELALDPRPHRLVLGVLLPNAFIADRLQDHRALPSDSEEKCCDATAGPAHSVAIDHYDIRQYLVPAPPEVLLSDFTPAQLALGDHLSELKARGECEGYRSGRRTSHVL